jgi:hypothetical protein
MVPTNTPNCTNLSLSSFSLARSLARSLSLSLSLSLSERALIGSLLNSYFNSAVENQWNSTQHLGRKYRNVWGDFEEELFPQQHDHELAQVIHVNTDTEIMAIVGV